MYKREIFHWTGIQEMLGFSPQMSDPGVEMEAGPYFSTVYTHASIFCGIVLYFILFVFWRRQGQTIPQLYWNVLSTYSLFLPFYTRYPDWEQPLKSAPILQLRVSVPPLYSSAKSWIMNCNKDIAQMFPIYFRMSVYFTTIIQLCFIQRKLPSLYSRHFRHWPWLCSYVCAFLSLVDTYIPLSRTCCLTERSRSCFLRISI